MSNQYKPDFIRILESLDRSKGRTENFRSFCEMSFCALAKKTAHDESRAEALEARYMEIVGTYGNKDDVRKMPELLGLVTMALHDGGRDFLGEIAGEVGALDKKNGQFFTPYDVSKFMAALSLGGFEAVLEKDGFLTLSDPAAGAGCMLLAAADLVEEGGRSVMDCMSAQAVELNRSTYHMLYVQLALRGIPAAVIHGNSLSLEVFDSAYTSAAVYFAGKHGRLFKENKNRAEKTAARVDKDPLPLITAEQLSLFG